MGSPASSPPKLCLEHPALGPQTMTPMHRPGWTVLELASLHRTMRPNLPRFGIATWWSHTHAAAHPLRQVAIRGPSVNTIVSKSSTSVVSR
mmetsp:Transcript_74289/g.225257  ORF Transcript_74289/g.225257 Transcript_74289/m.225257 type:complete len:91 (+) Transcript_74289:217-489(+)